jgi:hypothetical protein
MNYTFISSFERIPPRLNYSIVKVKLFQGCCVHIFVIKDNIVPNLSVINYLVFLYNDWVQWKKQVHSLSTIFIARSLIAKMIQTTFQFTCMSSARNPLKLWFVMPFFKTITFNFFHKMQWASMFSNYMS